MNPDRNLNLIYFMLGSILGLLSGVMLELAASKFAPNITINQPHAATHSAPRNWRVNHDA